MRPLRMLVRIALVNKQWIFMPGLGHLSFEGGIAPLKALVFTALSLTPVLAVYRQTETGSGQAPGETNSTRTLFSPAFEESDGGLQSATEIARRDEPGGAEFANVRQ